MNRKIHHHLTIILCGCAALLFTACGGGGGNGSATLATASFAKSFGSVADTANYYPFSSQDDLKVQTLYLADEINGSGNISALRFNRSANVLTDLICTNMTIRMGHTNLTALTTTFANNIETGQGSLQTVLNNQTVTIPAGAANDWFEVPLSTSFQYNGTDNLVVELEKSSACSGVSVGVALTVTNSVNRRAVSYAVDGSPGTAEHNLVTADAVDQTQIWMKFAFNGGVNKQEFGGASTNSWPFCGTVGSEPREQLLYLASEIDGSGPITAIGFQLNDTMTAAGSYTTTITMAHTTLTALTSDFTANYDLGTPVTVANNVTFSIHAGLVAGDWYWVPLPTASFNYDGTNNLIVEITTPETTTPAECAPNRAAGVAGARNWGHPGDTSGIVDTVKRHTKFRFNGAPMTVAETNVAAYGVPFDGAGTGAIIQALYGAHVLGTGAAIESVSFRLGSTLASSVSLPGVRVVLGNTTLTDLGVTLADNMDDATEVFNGTLDLTAASAGDWITIPVSGFTYDPTKNLTVQLEAGTTSETIPFLYGGAGVVSNTGGATGGSTTVSSFEGTRHPHLQLGFTK